MKRNILAAILLLTFITFSCTTQEEPLQDNTASSRSDLALVDDGSIVDEPTVTVEEFILDDEETPDTKTTLSFDGSGAKFTFVDGDRLGIFPYSTSGATQYPFTLKSSNTSSAIFNCPGFSLTAGTQYAAYYPYNATDGLAATSVPVSYTGQTQTSVDGSTFNISSADYLMAQATPSGNACQFTMSHVGALVVLYLTVLDTGTYNELSICIDKESNKSFVTGGTLNVGQNLEEGIKLANTTTSKKVSLTLGSGSGLSLSAGQTYTFCMMVYPVDLSGSLVTVKLRDSNGKYHHAITPSMSRNLRQGYAYRFYPAIARTNLSTTNGADSGGTTQTANCYIVDTDDINAAGYKFICTFPGNGFAPNNSSRELGNYSFIGGDPYPAGSFSADRVVAYLNQNSCVSNYYVSESYVYFKASGAKGNAKLTTRNGVDDSDYNVWTWHIWCTDKPGEVKFAEDASSLGHTYYVMDRNLGALTNGVDGSNVYNMYGLYYQFGNPMPYEASDFISRDNAGYTMKYPTLWPSKVFTSCSITGKSNNSWFITYNDSGLFGILWGGGSTLYNTGLLRGPNTKKNFYDPCPPLYKVAPSDFIFTPTSSNAHGVYRNGCFFPYNGSIRKGWQSEHGPYNPETDMANYVCLWTSGASDSDLAYYYQVSSKDASRTNPPSHDRRLVSYGMGVRCVKE